MYHGLNLIKKIVGYIPMTQPPVRSVVKLHKKFAFQMTQQPVPSVVNLHKEKFGFQLTQQPVPSVVNWRRVSSYVVEPTVFDRDDDLKKIVQMVLDQAEQERVAVLPIVGMPGMGKTTLAQLVYDSERIQTHFDLKEWVCVPEEFDVAHLARSIFDLPIVEDNNLPLEPLSEIFRTELGGKRLLLVLDDLRNDYLDNWVRELMQLLDCTGPGSVVIVTTCSSEVASIVGTMESYMLPPLSERALLNIFKQRAFGMGVDEQPQLSKIGERLLKHCASPLVARTLGGLMRYKQELSEWLILDDNISSADSEKYNISSVLKLSYENLPSHIKPCFVFCAVYPKGYEMDRDTLIQLWMANSYIPSQENMGMMEVKGFEIFNELAWRGFFQDIRRNYHGVVCKMHDLIHDFAKFLAVKERAIWLDLHKQWGVLSNVTLHVSCSSRESMSSVLKGSFLVRTILAEDLDEVTLHLATVNSFRAISLRKAPIKEIDVGPRALIHLRYLDLSQCIYLRVLPKSLCTAYNLQTLKLSYCESLEYLPRKMSNMCNLRHVYLDGCFNLKCVPAGLGKLRSLQTLTKYIVDPANGCGIEELKDLNLRGQLELYGLSKLRNIEDAREADLSSKTGLNHLYLSWGSVQSVPIESDDSDVVESNPDTDSEILKGLKPNQELEILEIRQYNGTKFSDWLNSGVLRNLTELSLVECKQIEEPPPTYGTPLLKKLTLIRLNSLKYLCSNMYPQLFPELEHLSLVDMPSLENWLENDPEQITSLFLSQLGHGLDDVYDELERLELKDIASLKSWPKLDAERLTSLDFPKLQELIILRCPKLDALPSCPVLRVLEIAGETNIPSSLIESFENKGVLIK
jgi:structure-specific endonuclease subunit SLX1